MKRIKCSGVLWIGCALAAGCAAGSGSEQASGEAPEGESAQSDSAEALLGGTRAPVAVCEAVDPALTRQAGPVWCEYRGTGNSTAQPRDCPADNDGAEVRFCIQQAAGPCEMPTVASKWQLNGTQCTFAQIAYLGSPGGCATAAAQYKFKWVKKQLQACK